jgi:hypothetical protein
MEPVLRHHSDCECFKLGLIFRALSEGRISCHPFQLFYSQLDDFLTRLGPEADSVIFYLTVFQFVGFSSLYIFT